MLTMTSFAIGLAVWLVTGLLFEAVLCLRQWRHLESRRVDAADAGRVEHGANERQVVYGQRRALFQWLASVEAVARVLIWLAAGGLAVLHGGIAAFFPLGGLGLFVIFAGLDQLLREILPWARWWFVDRACGMSKRRWPSMLADSARRLGVNVVLALLAGVWLLWPFALWPFAMAWPVSAVAVVAGAATLFWARPNLVDPLFNRFDRLPAGELRDRLDAMMQRCGTHLDEVLVVDNSRRSNLANAYFTGLGRHKRVVLLDTLIQHLSPAELEAVMAHELGHYRCGHLQRFYGSQAALLLLGYLVFGVVVALAGASAPPAMLVIGAYVLLPALAWPLRPWTSARRRRYEYEADAYAATHAERTALVSALRKLLANNLNAPTMDRWYAAVFATHPPGEHRLERLGAGA
jgi:STE24 endopeptidase